MQQVAITSPLLLRCIKECCEDVSNMGLKVPSHIDWYSMNSIRRAGQANSQRNVIRLSTYIVNDTEKQIKSTIYHELAHLIVGCQEGHGYKWKKTAQIITGYTGIPITRCYNMTDRGGMRAAYKSQVKYVFRCKDCGLIVERTKKTKFVREYNQLTSSGKPIWRCAKCGGQFELIKGGE